jgi:hypothetical protein
MIIRGGQFGNTVNATISIMFDLSISEQNVSIGFRQEYLRITAGPLAVRAKGLGYDEMREFPFFYTESGRLFDYRLTPYPSWISRRHYAAWTETSAMALYLGPISEQNITEVSYCGDLIEFENLTVYFEDNSSFVCGPRLISLAANFTKTGDGWDTALAIETSDNEGVTIESNIVTVLLRYPEPLSPVTPIVGVGACAALLVGVYVLWRRSKEPPE